MNRAEKIRTMLAHAAAAKAIRAELEEEARRELLDEDTRARWDLPGISTYASTSNDRAEVADPEAFFDYLEKRYPTEVVTKTIREVHNQRWLTDLLAEWASNGPAPQPPGRRMWDEPPDVMDSEGTIIPGLKWIAGGEFKSLTVRPDGAVSRRLEQAARRYARGDAGLADLQRAALSARHVIG